MGASWTERLKARGEQGGRQAPPSSTLEGDGLVDILLRLSACAGREAERAQFTASLPLTDDDLDPRFASFALARVGIDARWLTMSVKALTPEQLPAVIALADQRYVLVKEMPAPGVVVVETGEGEHSTLVETLAAQRCERILVVGHIDPVNGSLVSDERARIQANPRLWLISSFLTEKRHFVQLLLSAVLLNLCAFAVPLYMRAVYDRVVPNLAVETMWALSTGIMLVLCFEWVFKHVRSTFLDAIGLKVGQAIQHRAMTSILQARLDRSNWTVGSMMTALRDIESMAVLVPQAVVTFLVDLPFFFLFLAIIGLIGGWVVVAPVLGALVMIGGGLVTAYALKFSAKRNSNLLQMRNNLVADIVGSLHTVKSNQAEGRFLRRWDILSDHIGLNSRGVRGWNDLPGVLCAFVVQAVTVGIVIISIYQIRAGMMTAGALIACNMLAGRAMSPISGTIAIVSRGYQSLTQFGALANLLALEPEAEASDAAVKSKAFRGQIGFQKLSYTYPDTDQTVLSDIDLVIKPGEKIGIIGIAGSGKSTLLKLVGGLIMPTGGRMLVDGHGIEQYAAAQIRNNIAFATQDAVLFDDTIYENIVLGRTDIDAELLEAALRASGVAAFVAHSKEGLSRRVGNGGCRLSGGQRQAVVLARAYMRDARILLLDEPTAAMDVDGEMAVIRGLRSYAHDRTVLIATHRFAVLELVDRVLWMEEGRIVSDSPRSVIMEQMRQRQQSKAA